MKKIILIHLLFFGFIASLFFLKFPERTVFASPPTSTSQTIPVTPKPCTQDINPCNPSSCSYNLEKCKSTPPTTISIKQTYLTVYCGKTTCSQSEYCYHEQTGESNCLPIKNNYCGGGGLENVYPIKQCNPPEYNCLPILLGTKDDLPRVCIKVLGGETKKAKVEIKEIPSNNGEPSYMIKTETVQVISKVKVETNDKDEIKVMPVTKKIPSPVIILNPEGITDRLTVRPEQISLDISCGQAEACRPVYEIVTYNAVKLLGVIPISYSSTQTLDAATADQISESKPWFVRLVPFLFR